MNKFSKIVCCLSLLLCSGTDVNAEEEGLNALIERGEDQVERIYRDSTIRLDLRLPIEEQMQLINYKAPQDDVAEEKEEQKAAEEPKLSEETETSEEQNNVENVKDEEPENEVAEVNEQMAVDPDKEEKDAQCVARCGNGFYFDRIGEEDGGQEIVCTKYPLKCGYDCTQGWDINYLDDGSNYICQTAQQVE